MRSESTHRRTPALPSPLAALSVLVLVAAAAGDAGAQAWTEPVRGSWVSDGEVQPGDVVLAGPGKTCSIVLPHPAVSRRHARITLSGHAPVLEDLKSANGTYVNENRVERAVLKPGDVVRFGADPSCSYVLRDR